VVIAIEDVVLPMRLPVLSPAPIGSAVDALLVDPAPNGGGIRIGDAEKLPTDHRPNLIS
jgi:hypothetical protein